MKSRELLPYQIVLGVVTGSIAGIIAILGELRDKARRILTLSAATA